MSIEATSEPFSAEPKPSLPKRALFGALNFGSLAVTAWGTLKFLGHLVTIGLHDASKHGWVIPDSVIDIAEVAFVITFVVMVLRVSSGLVYAVLGNATGKPSDLAAFHRTLVQRWPLAQMLVPAPCTCCGRGGPRPWGHQVICACVPDRSAPV